MCNKYVHIGHYRLIGIGQHTYQEITISILAISTLDIFLISRSEIEFSQSCEDNSKAKMLNLWLSAPKGSHTG
jgi:hypothetical protein